jgi:hypothetical protein
MSKLTVDSLLSYTACLVFHNHLLSLSLLITLYRAINNYLDQRRLSDFVRISTMLWNVVFLVAYTCFNLETFAENRSNRPRRCMSILRYLKHHYKSKIQLHMNLLCSEVKTILKSKSAKHST